MGSVGLGVFETCQGLGDAAWHGDVDCAVGAVPVEGEATISGAVPIGGHGASGLNGVDWVLGIVFSDVFDSTIVNHKGKN